MGKIVYVRTTEIYNDSRATKEILTLAELGREVIVLAWNRKGDAKDVCNKMFKDFPQVKFYFYECLMPNGIGIKNIGKLFLWLRWVDKRLNEIDEIEVIHACNLDAGLGAFKYYRKKGIKFVYDIYDYYIDSHTIPNLLVGFIENLEISIINSADITIICTEERREQIKKAKPRNVLVIHNSPNVENVGINKIKYDYVYCGSLGSGRLIAEILNSYENNSDLIFAFAGYGENAVIAEKLSAQFENFYYLGVIPYSEVIELEKEAMAISAIYKPNIRNHRLCAPNKFYEALALAKPVIVCEGTGIDKAVKEKNIGIVIEYDVDEFYKALRKLKKETENTQKMGIRARVIYDDLYKWSVMEQRLLAGYRGHIFRGDDK